ncbi:acyltransferase family protein [Variovorax sp. PBL-E5]|uniref:acyltransferase family protein n=1 Tax=Variovorax sp. PBL-E5 TaxID=434014 RepID=UPI00131879DA|nr:acyltransferase [Variovorax sp. PBL-E5]VTU28322.1 Acyltransferase family protein [Variovorax sp. PBL-E5]
MQLPQFEKWSLLAALRFLLASIVAFDHLREYVPIGAWSLIPKLGAFEAVLGFLLISGYSIGASFIKVPDGFLIRRVKRIYPVYLASIVLAYIVFVMEHGSHPPVLALLANVLFLNQIVTATSFVGPAWSLALEFWLYSLTPLFFTLKDSTLRKLVFVSFGCYVAYTCGRTLFHLDYYAGLGYGANLLLLAFIWLAGLRLARNLQNPVPVLKDIALIFTVHILLAAAIQFGWRWKHGGVPDFFTHDIVDNLLQACTLALVLWAFVRLARRPIQNARASAVLRLLGDISYPLYLVHMSVYFLLKQTGLRSPILFYVSAVAVSFVIYWVLDFYSQRRHLRPAATAGGGRLATGVPRGES